MELFYTGVGSREISQEEHSTIISISEALASTCKWTLRSGGAVGSDEAFQTGAVKSPDRLVRTQVWLPWSSFRKDFQECTPWDSYEVLSEEEFMRARDFYLQTGIISWFDNMTSAAQRLHARNFYQVVGKDHEEVSKMCIYCADEENREVKGGTRSTVMVARAFKIPTYNIRIPSQKKKLFQVLMM